MLGVHTVPSQTGLRPDAVSTEQLGMWDGAHMQLPAHPPPVTAPPTWKGVTLHRHATFDPGTPLTAGVRCP